MFRPKIMSLVGKRGSIRNDEACGLSGAEEDDFVGDTFEPVFLGAFEPEHAFEVVFVARGFEPMHHVCMELRIDDNLPGSGFALEACGAIDVDSVVVTVATND